MTTNKRKPKVDPDWWLHEELLPPDPWAYIVCDFKSSADVLRTMHRERFACGPVIIGGMPEFRSPEERIEFAFSLAMNIQPEVLAKISEKSADDEFLWLWGEYQKAIAILISAYPEYQEQQLMIESSVARSQKKREARQWYILWFEWHKKWPEAKHKTRAGFENFFEGFLQELRAGARAIPEKHQCHVQELIEQYLADPDEEDEVRLTNFFQSKKFYGNALEKTLELAKTNSTTLPPIGISEYPKN